MFVSNYSKVPKVLVAIAALALCPAVADATPLLQLNIGGGVYDLGTQTIISSGPVFTLYAYLTPQNNSDVAALLAQTYYISVAVVPAIGPPGGSLGSFTFDGTP
jgi:hypothetical protein